MIRKIRTQAALALNTKPRELSFKGALNIIKSFRERDILCEKNNKIAALLQAISHKIVVNLNFILFFRIFSIY
jgi:hypothetical protein